MSQPRPYTSEAKAAGNLQPEEIWTVPLEFWAVTPFYNPLPGKKDIAAGGISESIGSQVPGASKSVF